MSGSLEFKIISSPSEFQWIVDKHREVYIDQYGWKPKFIEFVTEIVDDFMRSQKSSTENAWFAMHGNQPVGCVMLVKKDKDVAKLRLLLVDPIARGLGVGSELVKKCTEFAREQGYKQITLWTNSDLSSARKIYESQGYRLISKESNPEFAISEIFENWTKDL